MAEEESGQDRSEEATPERREEFREKGELALSRDLSQALAFLFVWVYLSSAFVRLMGELKHRLIWMLGNLGDTGRLSRGLGILAMGEVKFLLNLIVPLFLALYAGSMAGTFFQTKLSFAWPRISPNFERLNPLSGFKRMVDSHAWIEVAKSLIKLTVLSLSFYAIMRSDWSQLPRLMFVGYQRVGLFWAQSMNSLFWTIILVGLSLALADYFQIFLSYERKLRMTKQEIKEEYKKRETDPHVKGRMRRMQRDFAQAKTIRATRGATAIITNPTHFAVAISYVSGQRAPRVVAKGQDFMALRMREVAGEAEVPIIENPPLARLLYKTIEVGQDIPESLWTAISEVIKYVIKLKGWQYIQNPKELSHG